MAVGVVTTTARLSLAFCNFFTKAGVTFVKRSKLNVNTALLKIVEKYLPVDDTDESDDSIKDLKILPLIKDEESEDNDKVCQRFTIKIGKETYIIRT